MKSTLKSLALLSSLIPLILFSHTQTLNDIYLSINKTDMTDSSSVIRSALHEQERHTQKQNGDTNSYSEDSQTSLSSARGKRGSTVWDDYSGLNGFDTKSSTTQTNWNNNNRNSKAVKAGTSKIKKVKSSKIKPYLSGLQLKQQTKELSNCKTTNCRLKIQSKYNKKSIKQGVDLAKDMAVESIDNIKDGITSIIQNPEKVKEALKSFINQPLTTLSEVAKEELENIKKDYETVLNTPNSSNIEEESKKIEAMTSLLLKATALVSGFSFIKKVSKIDSAGVNVVGKTRNINLDLHKKINGRAIQKDFENSIGFKHTKSITGKKANEIGKKQYGDKYEEEWNKDGIVKKVNYYK